MTGISFVILEQTLYILIIKGKASKTMPVRIRRYIFETKYGHTINPMPLNRGMMVFCLLP